jgi:acyl-coenzyme A thioesterase PaaI-like protein
MGETNTAGTDATPATYPPERHFLRDLDTTTWQVRADRLLMCSPLTDGVRNAAGSVALGQVAALVDIAGAPVALIAGAPDWTATQDMSLHATGWLTEGPVVVDARLVRAGRNTVVVAVDVYDGHGVDDLVVLGIDRLRAAGPTEADGVDDGEPDGVGPTRTATGLLTFARIPRSASASAGSFDPTALVGQQGSMTPPEPVVASMQERIGVEVVDAERGVVEIAHHDYVRNSFGTINGGVLGAVFQTAAEAVRPALVATDVQIHYLSQVRTGPARTSATVSRDAGDHCVVTVEAVDAGHDDQLLALATVVLQRPPA